MATNHKTFLNSFPCLGFTVLPLTLVFEQATLGFNKLCAVLEMFHFQIDPIHK